MTAGTAHHRRLLRSLGALAALGAAGMLLAACAGTSNSANPAARFVGTWGNTSPQRPYLTFKANKSVTGSDGCNRIVTTYTVSGDTATLKPAATTLMACPGVDTWLSNVHTATIHGHTIVVKNADGSKIGTLDRADG